jgi:hypothetical protein
MARARPRKVRLSPMQREILWILEEAGAEYIAATLNRLEKRFPEYSRDQFISTFEEAIRGLWELGFIALGRDYQKPGLTYVLVPQQETLEYLQIHEYAKYDQEKDYWFWDGTLGDSVRLSFMLTKEGRQALTT